MSETPSEPTEPPRLRPSRRVLLYTLVAMMVFVLLLLAVGERVIVARNGPPPPVPAGVLRSGDG